MKWNLSPVALNEAPVLALNGNIGYRIDDHRVCLTVDEIANNRTTDNVSGTLALELWALSQPYQSGDFDGVAVAGTQIGELLGQHCLRNCSYDLNFLAPTPGTWHLCLMLREWDGHGYVTRDAVSFGVPYVVAAPERADVAVSRSDNSNVITLAFKEGAAEVGSSTEATESKNEAAASRNEAAAIKPVTAATPSAATPPAATRSARRQAKAESQSVEWGDVLALVNNASRQLLESIKGVSKKLARSIESGRPYSSHEELLKVKGMGKKMLEKLEQHIRA